LLWPTLRQALVAHEHSEVRELYPILRQRADTRPLADHHDDEARDLDAMIGRLDRTPDASEAWGPLFDQLAQTVLAHVEEEERSIFPAAQDAFGELQSQELETTVLAAKQKMAMLW
jgi:hemerythrin superfamily protein